MSVIFRARSTQSNDALVLRLSCQPASSACAQPRYERQHDLHARHGLNPLRPPGKHHRTALDTAQRLRLPAIGIVDRATTLAHAPLATLARDTGVHVVYGATLMMEDGYPLRLLARNEDGYRNLCRLVSWQAQNRSRLAWDTIKIHNKGLYLLCGGRRSRLWQLILDGDKKLLWHLARLQALGEKDDRFVVEMQQYPTDAASDHTTFRKLLKLTQQAGVRTIARHDVQMLDAADAPKHRMLHAINQQLPF